MKIGILTFHRAHNYGAVLQAYALQEYLYSLNQKVEFIDYKNRKLLEVYRWFNDAFAARTKIFYSISPGNGVCRAPGNRE